MHDTVLQTLALVERRTGESDPELAATARQADRDLRTFLFSDASRGNESLSAHIHKQIERVRALRSKRAPGPCKSALEAVEQAARSGANLMPSIVSAVEACATVGEISDAMRRVFGEYKEAVVI